MKDASVLALIITTYVILAVVFLVVTSVKLDRPFLLPTPTLSLLITITIIPTASTSEVSSNIAYVDNRVEDNQENEALNLAAYTIVYV